MYANTILFFFMFSAKLTGFSRFFLASLEFLPPKSSQYQLTSINLRKKKKKKSNFPSGVYSSSASKQTATEKLFFFPPYNSSRKVFARKAYKKSSVKQISIRLIHRATQWKFSSAGSAIRSPQLFKHKCTFSNSDAKNQLIQKAGHSTLSASHIQRTSLPFHTLVKRALIICLGNPF